MFEAFIACSVTLCLLALAFAGAYVRWSILLAIGSIATGVFFVASIPIGFAYHVALYRALNPLGRLPVRWWLKPVSCHQFLEPEQRPAVMLWYMLGVSSLVLTLLGCALALFASLLSWHVG